MNWPQCSLLGTALHERLPSRLLTREEGAEIYISFVMLSCTAPQVDRISSCHVPLVLQPCVCSRGSDGKGMTSGKAQYQRDSKPAA